MSSRIAQLRKARGISQADLGEAVGLGQSAISKIERGETSDAATLRKIAEALGVDPTELEGVRDEPAASVDAQPVPTMSAVPGWPAVEEQAKRIATEVSAEAWDVLNRSPGLLSSDVPLTPAVVTDLARLVQRHLPLRKK